MPARTSNVLLGVALVIAGAFLISVQDVIVKSFNGVLPLWQIFVLRGVFTAPLIIVFAWVFRSETFDLRAVFERWTLIRAASMSLGLFLFYIALPFISLATAGAGIYLAPVFLTIMSARIAGEPVGRLGWLGVLIGFAGAIVLLQPGSDAFSPWAVLPILGAVFYAIGHIITRTKCQNAPASALGFSYNLLMTIGAAVASVLLMFLPDQASLGEETPYLFSLWRMPDVWSWGLLLLLGGVFAGIGILLAAAYQVAPPSTVGTFEYSYLLFAIVWDISLFGAVPGMNTIVGVAMIVLAGVLVLRSSKT